VNKKQPPVRMCIGCSEHKLKKELIRIVKNNEGEVSVDFSGKKPGRGAYICRDTVCFEKAYKEKKLQRIFEIEINKEIFEQLKREVESENGKDL
jgi:predicted RNA-binding protein YlxR (DUF448 family)